MTAVWKCSFTKIHSIVVEKGTGMFRRKALLWYIEIAEIFRLICPPKFMNQDKIGQFGGKGDSVIQVVGAKNLCKC